MVDPKRSAAAKKAWRTRRKRRAIGFYKDKQGRTRPITPPKKTIRIDERIRIFNPELIDDPDKPLREFLKRKEELKQRDDRAEDLLDEPEPGRWLSEKEKDALLQINSFSAMRKYRYGLNEKHVYYREAIPSLFKKGLIFYKKAHGNRYWLPTKKGRNIAGQLVLEAKWSDGFWDMAHAHD